MPSSACWRADRPHLQLQARLPHPRGRSARTEDARTRLLAPMPEPSPTAMTPTNTLTATAQPVFYVTTEDHHPENGTLLGFWLYLMSDCLIFASCSPPTPCWAAATRPAPRRRPVRPAAGGVNTSLLLLSSITYGFAMLADAAGARRHAARLAGHHRPVRRGLHRPRAVRVRAPDPRRRGPQRSAFLSAFFTLVGTHGLHVTFGIVWLVTLMVQVPSTA
jgi:cytochrome o ubiquinol oxidase subunit 3